MSKRRKKRGQATAFVCKRRVRRFIADEGIGRIAEQLSAPLGGTETQRTGTVEVVGKHDDGSGVSELTDEQVGNLLRIGKDGPRA